MISGVYLSACPGENPRIPKKNRGRRHFCMAAQIRHVGKCSGRAYVMPAGARVVSDMALIPRTFGNQSDWSKNRRREARPDSWPGPRSGRSSAPASGRSASAVPAPARVA